MNSYAFHISLYDLFFLGAIFTGLTFAFLLLFTKTINRTANRFLALALITMILWMMRLLAIDTHLDSYLPHWDRIPMQFLLALGPLIYFYVLKITRRQYKLGWRDLLHFSPLLLEQGVLALEIGESNKTGAATYDTQVSQQLNPILQVLVFVSMISYLYKSNRLIEGFYRQLQPVLMDRPLLEFRWLRRLLAATGLLWCLWIAFVTAGHLVYPDQPAVQVYYPFYVFFAVIMIWTAAAAFLKPQAGVMTPTPAPVKWPVPGELRAKAAWLKKAMEANRYYEEPELSLPLLAEKLQLPSHELSRVINSVFKKSFNDFINEYRVRDVISRMQDPAFDKLTLLGIAYDAGFNSKSTFNRAFRQITGKTPAQYKMDLENKVSSYDLAPYPNTAAIILSHQTTPKWDDIKLNGRYMFKNYLKTAWHSLIRNKIYSLINVLGLALGICACLVIYLIARYEFSFDTFHPDRDRIFCVDAIMHGNHMNSVPGPMPGAMRREMTGIETLAAFLPYTAGVRIPGDDQQGKPKQFEDDGSLVITEPSYFDIFRYQWLSGNAATSLATPHSVVLTAEKARKYFGDADPSEMIGRTLYYRDSLMVTVTGIVADWTGNSDFNYGQWLSYATIPVSFLQQEIKLDAWNSFYHSSQVMVKLAKNVNPSQVDAQFTTFAKRYYGSNPPLAASLQPLSGIHFHKDYGGTGRKSSLPVLYTLIGVAGIILILAIVNFVNLSTAQSMQRAREIGVRKVLGGSRAGIAAQFFTETLLLTVVAVFLSLLMLRPVFSLFEGLIPGGVQFRADMATLLFLLLVVVVTTLLAGFYPSKVLGNYKPAVTLKGIAATKGGGKGTLRRGLIVGQFAISLLFIIASFVIGSQLRYLMHANLGFKTDAIITINPPRENKPGVTAFASDRERSPQPAIKETNKVAVLTNKIRQRVGVAEVIREWKPPLDDKGMHFGGSGLKNSEEDIEASFHFGDEEFVPFYGMQLVAGRNLLPGDSTKEVLISESFARAMGFTDLSKAIGREVRVSPVDAYPVCGVIADFYERSFHQASLPVIIQHDPMKETTIAVKIDARNMTAGELKTLLGHMENDWKSVFPGQAFSYSFLDESIANMYTEEIRTARLTNVAMAITVFISCLGLLGLAIFSTERRTREIGIRKVLGATVPGIIAMLCKDIVRLILIALLIAAPLAWYFMHDWLQGFAYRTALSAWIFVAAGAAAIALALLTVGFQAMKAAFTNPVKSLRTE